MRVVVVGGGVAGAACAVALRRTGAAVTIYEAYPDPAGPDGSFISLAANGLRSLRALDALTQVEQAGFPVARQRMWSGAGRLLGDVPRGRRAADPVQSITLLRRDLVGALRGAATRVGAELITGERVEATGDGRLRDADVIVGADGIWSSTRHGLDPSAPRPADAGLITVSGESAGLGGEAWNEPGTFNMIFGRRGSFIAIPAPDGMTWWSAQFAPPGALDPESVGLDQLAAFFRSEPTVCRILRAARPAVIATRHHTLADVSRQHDGRTVLIGDAAHPVGAGQGASMAIEDAVVLARELSVGRTIPEALSSFERVRRARLGKMAKAARTNRDAKTAGPFAARFRNLVMPLIFNRVYPRATGWLYDFDPGALPVVSEP